MESHTKMVQTPAQHMASHRNAFLAKNPTTQFSRYAVGLPYSLQVASDSVSSQVMHN